MPYLRCLGLIEAISFLYRIGKIDQHFVDLVASFEEKVQMVDQEALKPKEKERLAKSIKTFYSIVQTYKIER